MADGRVIETRRSLHGIQHLPAAGVAGFEQALAAVAADCLQRRPRLPLVACGMVGSAQRWCEAPYARCPVDLRSLAVQGVMVATGIGPELRIVPGVLSDPPGALPDVMRGEQTQIVGAAGDGGFVLPGTHSKRVQVEGGRSVRFATCLTGELFAVLRTHSIRGRLMPPADAAAAGDDKAFALGLDPARDRGAGDLLNRLFATRRSGLTGRLPVASLADFLPGLLIGHEIVSGLGANAAVLDNTAAAGLWHMTEAAGLIESPTAS